MIAKLIVHGADREAALRRLKAALGEYEVVGVQTNLALLRGIATDAAFASGDVDTEFIGRHQSLLHPARAGQSPIVIAAAALSVLRTRAMNAANEVEPNSPWSAQDSWRMNLDGAQSIMLLNDGAVLRLLAHALAGGAHRLVWQDADHTASLRERADGRVAVTLDDAVRTVTVVQERERLVIVFEGENHVFELLDELSPPRSAMAGADRVIAPIPGRVASVLVEAGQVVVRGQVLVVLEAMKMELALTATTAGTIHRVLCQPGDLVEEGRELVDFVDTTSN